MTKHLTLLLIFWSAVLGCNQSDTYEDKTIYGLRSIGFLIANLKTIGWRGEYPLMSS